MTNRTPRYDTDSDDKIDNPQVDALANFAQSDTFSGYPLDHTDLPDKTMYAAPGEVQSVIDTAAGQADVGAGFDKARQRVALESGKVYDEGTEIHVKPGVTLAGNGANIGNTQNGGDHNILFLDNATDIEGLLRIGIDQTVTYTSDAVVYDSDRTQEGKYGIGAAGSPADTQSHMRAGHIDILGSDPSTSTLGGTGVAFRGGSAFTIGGNIDVSVLRMENGVFADQNATFTNFDPSDVTTLGCVNAIRQGANSTQFKTPLRVSLQPSGAAERMIWNESTEAMPITQGAHWDPSNAATNALVGPKIHLRQQIMTNADWTANSDGNNQQVVFQPGANPFANYNRMEHPGTGGEWGLDLRDGHYRVTNSDTSTEWLRLGQGSKIRNMAGGFSAAAVNGAGITSTSPDGDTTKEWNTQNDGSWG